MGLYFNNIRHLSELLGEREASNLIRLVKQQEKLESVWKRKIKKEIERITDDILENASKTGRLNLSEVDFSEIIMEHSFSVSKEAITSTNKPTPIRSERLASPPKGRIPKSLKELRIMWDAWAKRGAIPPRQKKMAETLKKAYIKKLEDVWKKYGEEFRSGDTADKTRAIKAIKSGADVTYSRAKMIVETETTYYYNKTRKEIYDQSEDVTHYLFLAIRDAATTKWCKTRQGKVFKKGSELLAKNTPPCHWNCRSEILPLTPHNPTHRKIIEDKGRQASNSRLAPLPIGWTGR